jgi:hypothetical protein
MKDEPCPERCPVDAGHCVHPAHHEGAHRCAEQGEWVTNVIELFNNSQAQPERLVAVGQ